jgi:hypothetical protein
MALTDPSGPRPHCRGFTIIFKTNYVNSVGPLWTSNQRNAQTSTQKHTTLIKRRMSIPPAGLEPAISASKQLHTHALDRAANGIGCRSALTYLLTYSMEQSPCEANRFAATQEIHRILRNPKVHYGIYKCPPPVSILSQLMSLFRCLGSTKVPVQFRGFVNISSQRYVFTVRSCLHLAQPPSWRTTPCRLSVTAYSTYSKLPSILEGPFLHTQLEDAPGRGDRDPTYHGLINSDIVLLHSCSKRRVLT